MKLLEVLFTKNSDLFRTFIHNSFPAKLEKRILENDIFYSTYYFYVNHRIYLVKHLVKHPVYKNQLLGFDLI